MKKTMLLLALGCALALSATPALGATLPSGFHEEVALPGLLEPTTLRFAPDGRVFVAEKTGVILVFDSLADTTPTVFADLRTDIYDTNDRGLLGLALDPEFPTRPYVYALYTYDHLLGDPAPAPKWGIPDHTGDICPKPPDADSDACPVSGRIVRLTAVLGGDHAAVDGDGEVEQHVLVEGWCTQYSSHSIGDLQFDSKGVLYASGGEGSNAASVDFGQGGWPNRNQCGDPPAGVGGIETPPTAEGGALRAQDVRTLADPTGLGGTVIRIDPETGKGLPSNPFYGTTSDENARRIIAYGFRNPFRFAIDPVSDEIYVGNVGWYTYEEIDRFSTDPEPAFNSGWPCFEGPGVTPVYSDLGLNICEDLYFKEPGLTAAPFYSYEHEGGVTPEDTCTSGGVEPGSAIAGLDFYEGEEFPASYKGGLFFSDPVRGCIYVIFPGDDGRPDPSTAVPFMTEEAGLYPAVDIEEGPDGNLYYAQLFGAGFGLGAIHRITYNVDNQPPVARLGVDNQWSAGDLDAKFDASGSSDADGEALEYEWDPENTGSYEAATPDSTLEEHYTDSVNHTVAVRVRDGKGATSVDRITVYPHDTPPVPVIVTPAETAPGSGKAALKWHVGQSISFTGQATQGATQLPAVNLDWSSRLLHCPSGCHAHPLQAFPSVASGALTAPDHEYPSRIDLTLTAVDGRGLEGTKTIEIFPEPVQLAFRSEPAGVPLGAAEVSEPAPFDLTAIEDSNMTISAPATAEIGGAVYAWSGWSDGGARVHAIVASLPKTYTAVYSKAAEPEPESKSSEPQTQPPQPPSPGPGEREAVPQTKLGQRPPKTSHATTARFTFSADQTGVSFRCKLDRGAYLRCNSPQVYRHLKRGTHVFQVVALNGKGTADLTPAAFRWTIAKARG